MGRRPDIDGGAVIAALIATITVLLTVVALDRIQPASQVVGSPVTAPLTRLETPLTPPTSSTTMPPPPPALNVTTTPPATVGPGEVFYPDCVAARTAGASDLRRGDPGYRAQLDRDADGRACESPPVPPTAPPAPPTSRPPLIPLPRPTTSTRPPTRTTAPPPFLPSTPPPPILTTAAPILTTTAASTTTPPPSTDPPTTVEPTTEPPTTTTLPRFTDCNQVVAAGIDVPLTADSPWWNPALDVDGDGLACEDDAPDPIPTTTTTVTPLVDCVAAWDLGVAPIFPDSPYWNPAWDPDGRGVACQVDPRTVTVVSSTSSSTETTAGDGR